ncbi:acyl-CoA-binding protein [Pontibacter sp. G13]|uniref:acyl-CoA-binding protein n=1 Tax=Pontibacter sp. G13 TaxID=3074898 RepID=UPI00288BE470|nr:acyl-CoA-binding protein [Pontibacter sp. G13]WNJ17986.1 acyl-CoA-binding protein [Pontibacter sp. G13]
MNLEEKFNKAREQVMTLKDRPSNEMLLKLYGLNKQATVGDINIPAPAVFDFVAKAKYNAWEANKGVAKQAAMEQYIQLVEELMTAKPES